MLLYRQEVCIRFVRIEDFITVHDCDEVFGIRQVDYIVSIAWKHMNRFDLVAADFETEDFISVDATLLDKSVSAYDDEEFPLGVVPMLPLGYAWLADVDTYLAAVESVDKFSKAAPVIDVHL